MINFEETREETIGDFGGNEAEATAIINAILNKIDNLVISEYGTEGNYEVENANEIQNMVWAHVCDYSDDLSETEADYDKTAQKIYDGFVVVRKWGQ